MGRAYEYRKARKFARWDKMAKAFTRIGKDIAIAVKAGGPDPATNPRLRMAIQNAKGVNMPKNTVEAAIKRASSKEEKDYQELVYEGYAPFGVAIVIETATDNPFRTVANIRHYFSKAGGSLGTSGSLDFLFDRMGVFKIAAEGVNLEELELELIDAGAEDIQQEDNQIIIYTAFNDFGQMSKALEEMDVNVESAEVQRLPTTTKELSEADEEAVLTLIDKIEQDEDVQQVFHNLA